MNNFFKLFIICHLLLLKITVTWSKSQTRIVGGLHTSIYHAPSTVQILKDGKFHCGGTVLSNYDILTAAHCVEYVHPSRLTIVGGVSRTTENGVRCSVKQIRIPRTYNNLNLNMDVALLKLSSPMVGPPIKSICLCQQELKPGYQMQVYGWGKITEDAVYGQNQLRTTTVNVMSRAECRKMYHGRMNITDSMICADGLGKDSCSGDSGGPAIFNGQICGIVSWGIGCGRPDSPGVYSNVFKLRSLISDSIDSDDSCLVD